MCLTDTQKRKSYFVFLTPTCLALHFNRNMHALNSHHHSLKDIPCYRCSFACKQPPIDFCKFVSNAIKVVLATIQNINLWTNPALIYNYFKVNRIVVPGLKSLTRGHFNHFSFPISLEQVKFALGLVGSSSRKFSLTHLTNSTPSNPLTLWQSILGNLKFLTLTTL